MAAGRRPPALWVGNPIIGRFRGGGPLPKQPPDEASLGPLSLIFYFPLSSKTPTATSSADLGPFLASNEDPLGPLGVFFWALLGPGPGNNQQFPYRLANVRKFPSQTLKISKVSLVVMGS
jgi:hypothetical protein